MSRIITVWNKKGGEGKSTTRQALATISAQKGNRVLVLDLDSQRSTTEQLIDTAELEGKNTIHNVLMEGLDINEAIYTYHSKEVSMDFIPSSLLLEDSSAQMLLEGGRKPLHTRLGNSLSKLEEQYTHIFIDTPPAADSLVVNALACSTDLIIPLTASKYSITGISQALEIVSNIKTNFNDDLEILGIFINMERNSNTDEDFFDFCKSLPSFMTSTIPLAVDVRTKTFKDELLMEGKSPPKKIQQSFTDLYNELGL